MDRTVSASSTKMPMPARPVPSPTGQTIGMTPSVCRPMLRRPCSHRGCDSSSWSVCVGLLGGELRCDRTSTQGGRRYDGDDHLYHADRDAQRGDGVSGEVCGGQALTERVEDGD